MVILGDIRSSVMDGAAQCSGHGRGGQETVLALEATLSDAVDIILSFPERPQDICGPGLRQHQLVYGRPLVGIHRHYRRKSSSEAIS